MLVINVCCNKIILHRCENDRLNPLRDMDMNLNIHLQAYVQMNKYILHTHTHTYNLQDKRLSDIIVCLSFIGRIAHFMGEYLSVKQCVAQSTRSLAWPISEDEAVSLSSWASTSLCIAVIGTHTVTLFHLL